MSVFSKKPLAVAVSVMLSYSVAVSADDLANCAANANPAVYDQTTRSVVLDAVDVPLLDPFTGMPSGEVGVFSAKLQMQAGIEDFKLQDITYIEMADDFAPNHAWYQYFVSNSMFSDGGKLGVCVAVPQVITLPTGAQMVADTKKLWVTLKQLAIAPDIFHIENAQSVAGNGGDGSSGVDCSDPATKDAVQVQLLEMFTLIEAVKPMVVVDYISSGEWPHPLSHSITPPTGNWTSTFSTDAPPAGTYVDGRLKDVSENPDIHPLIAGKGVRFVFNSSSNTWSCSTNGIANPVPSSCLTLSGTTGSFCD